LHFHKGKTLGRNDLCGLQGCEIYEAPTGWFSELERVATAVCWSKIALSSSIIVLLLVAVALPVAPIAHQGDEVMACTTISEPGE